MSNADRILKIKRRIVDAFTAEQWRELALLTDTYEAVVNHPRLLRSLSFGDEDYSDCVVKILALMIGKSALNLGVIEKFVGERVGWVDEVFVSGKKSSRVITFSPSVFKAPEFDPDDDLVAVMMPFDARFHSVYAAIQGACDDAKLRCQRADSIWQESTFIQDIFNLIYRSTIVVVDFTDKNPNVMYETGIAHTLGKTVVPITQNLKDIPSDLGHHRALKYLANTEGFGELKKNLAARLLTLKPEPPPF